MSHFTEGVLQAYLDDEVGADARAQVRAHVSDCADCAARLELARESNALFAHAVAVLDTAATPRVAAADVRLLVQQQEWRERKQSTQQRWLRAAAVVVCVSAAAAATVPGSPVREWLVDTWNSLTNASEQPEARVSEQAPAGAVEPANALAVTPVGGRVRIALSTPARGTQVHVQLVDGEKAMVETAATRFRHGGGWLEAVGVSGEVRITLPRTLDTAYVEVDGRIYVAKEGEDLRYFGPAGAVRTDSEVTFRPAR